MARRLAIAAVSLAVALLAAEGLLRAFPLPTPGRIHFPLERRTVQLDPELIWRLAPNSSFAWETREFRETRQTSSIGLRDREVPPRAPGETRVLAIGDSFTFGHGVGAAASYPGALESELRGAGRAVSVFNAGVPGYGLDQSYRAFPERVRQVEPDVVLVGVHCSDVDEGWISPLYDLRDGELVALPAWKTGIYLQGLLVSVTPPWLYGSALYQQIARRIPGRDLFWQRPLGSRERLRAWARDKIEREIADLAARGRAAGLAVAAILMPCKETIEPAAPTPYVDLGARLAGGSGGAGVPVRDGRGVGDPVLARRGLGVPVLDGMAALRAAEPDVARLFFVEDVHLTAAGNRALAHAAAVFLERHGLLEPHGAGRGESPPR